MPTTSNFGWTTPADTDLVKDGAAAIRTLGNGIDTSFLDLKGGTTNQVLAKNSNTDLDFKWVADATGIPATIFDAKGDIIAATAADTADRLAVGTNGQYLSADSTTATGLKWVTATAAASNWSILNSGGTSLTGANTVTVSGITKNKILILISQASSQSGGDWIQIRFNSSSTAQYNAFGGFIAAKSSYSAATVVNPLTTINDSQIQLGTLANNAGSIMSGYLLVDGCQSAGVKIYEGASGADAATSNSQENNTFAGYWNNTSAISSVNIKVSTGGSQLDNGTVYILGSD